MVGQRLLSGGAALDRRAFLGLTVAAGAAAVLPATAGAASVPAALWRVEAWAPLVGRTLGLAAGGAVHLVEVEDRGLAGAARFSLLLAPVGGRLPEGLHTVLHPHLGPVPLGATSVGRAGRLLVVVDHVPPAHREQHHG